MAHPERPMVGYTDEFINAKVRAIADLVHDLEQKASSDQYTPEECRAYRYAATELYRIVLGEPS